MKDPGLLGVFVGRSEPCHVSPGRGRRQADLLGQKVLDPVDGVVSVPEEACEVFS